jgi:hypothetical protein
MQIPTNSIASLFSQMQSAVGATANVGASALQELLGGAASSTAPAPPTASTAPASLTATSPASQFSSQLLSALIAAQSGSTSGSSTTASTSSTSPTSLSLTQLENALTGSGTATGTTSAAAQSLASLFGDASSAIQTLAGQTARNPSTPSTPATLPTDQPQGEHHSHLRHSGLGSAFATLTADASSAISSTASLAAGLLASV